jgi:dUTP pyrophosphatase
MHQSLGFYSLVEGIDIPRFETEGAACFDLKASLLPGTSVAYYTWLNDKEEDIISAEQQLLLRPGCRYLVPTNLIMDIPEGHSVRIHPRSGLSLKLGLSLINCEGVIDSDYVNPVYLTLVNLSESIVVIKDRDRVAQGELVRQESYYVVPLRQPPQPKTSRKGGFGSTGQ